MSKETLYSVKTLRSFWKLSILSVFIFSGCSNVTYNAEMCDKIASDPTAVLPKECVPYKLKEAEKAFNNTKKNKIQSKEDLEVNKDKE